MAPQPLEQTSSRILEFDAFREVLAGYVNSPLGKARVADIVPVCERAWIENQQQLADEAQIFLRAGGHFDFGGLFGPQTLLPRARIAGSVLEIEELRDLLHLADKAAEWRETALHP